MGYYKPPTTFLLTLTLNAFLKTFFLRECESYLKEASLSVSQMLFMSFLISCGVSLFSLVLSGKRKAWSYKLVAVIGGRENSPKLGPGLFAGLTYMIRVGGLIVGSLLTSPFRAVMISEYIALCLLSSRSGSLGFSNLERKFQKLLVSLLPIAACLLFDYRSMAGTQLEEYINDEVVPNLGIFSAQPDLKTHHTFETLAFGYFGIIASSVAQCLLGWVFEPSISSSLTTTAIGRRAVTNQILFFSLVQGLAAVLLIPWLSSASIVPLGFETLFLYLGICFTLNLCEVVNFRISKLLPAHQDLPWINWLVSVIGAMVYCMFCFQAPEDPKSLFSFSDLLLVFLALVTLFLTRPGPLDKVPSKPTGLLSGIKGTSNLRDNLGHFLTAILASQDSKQIFYFMLLNLSYMFVQLAYGFWTNSLGLISDAIHMFFDCVALGVGLFAAVTSKWPKNHQFSYGYSRIEVLSGFSNGIFLALISIFIVLEAVGRLIHPPEMNTDRLLLISFLGLVVNLVGILAFNHGHGHCHSHGEPSAHVHIEDHAHDHSHDHKHHDHHSHDHKHHDHSHDHGHDHTDIHVHQSNSGHNHDHGHGHSHNMEGVFLHIMADTLGSVGVIISTLLIKYFGWTGFDPIASIFIAVLIFFSVLPLIRSSFAILLLYVPPDVSNRLRQAASKTESSLGGACKVLDGKIWPNDHDSYIATVLIELSPGINPTSVSPRIEKIFKEMLPSVKDLTLQFEVSN